MELTTFLVLVGLSGCAGLMIFYSYKIHKNNLLIATQEKELKFIAYWEPIFMEEHKKLSEIIKNKNIINRKKYDNEIVESNSTCPKCCGKDIIDKIIQQKGSITGGMYSSSGSWDTKPVNKCKSCENEWIKVVPYLHDEDFYKQVEHVRMFFHGINTKRDMFDKTDPYATFWANQVRAFWTGISIETLLKIEEMYGNRYNHYKWEIEPLEKLGLVSLRKQYQNEEIKNK